MFSYHPQISVVIPLYNEAGCLESNTALIENYLTKAQKHYELVFVNDGSTDSTGIILSHILTKSPCARMITYPINRGKGYAIRTGILNARGNYIIFMDADLAVPVNYIGKCIAKLESGAPIVIASRHLPGSCFKIRETPLRQLLGKIFRKFAKFCFALKVSDITCGLKGFDKKTAFDIFSRSRIERWGYDAEILFLAQKLGYCIEEIPVDWYHSFDSKVKIGQASVKTFSEMFQIYYYYLTNSYDQGYDEKSRIQNYA